MKKKIIIGVLIAALIAGGTAGGAVYYRKSHQSEVSVVSVDSLASQYYTDDTSLEGNIATSAVQSITIDKDMIVQDVYVSKGDTVKKGDKLVSFDMTLSPTIPRVFPLYMVRLISLQAVRVLPREAGNCFTICFACMTIS